MLTSETPPTFWFTPEMDTGVPGWKIHWLYYCRPSGKGSFCLAHVYPKAVRSWIAFGMGKRNQWKKLAADVLLDWMKAPLKIDYLKLIFLKDTKKSSFDAMNIPTAYQKVPGSASLVMWGAAIFWGISATFAPVSF